MIYYADYVRDNRFKPDLNIVHSKKICDNIICFDIETCNYFLYEKAVYSINDVIQKYNGNVKQIEDFFEVAQPGAVPYIWQFCIDGVTIYGREFKECKKVFDYIAHNTKGHTVHIWVHNLAFEYVWLQEILKPKGRNIFFTEAHKPLYFKYKNLYFRCSYRLTNMSLAKWGSNLNIPKKTGDLDYHALYTPKTELTKEELDYCETDVFIMYKGLQQYLKLYKHVEYIPLTQTSIIRKDIKEENKEVKGFIKQVAEMQPRTPDEWKVQHMTYSGGLTLCNPHNVGRLLYDLDSIDKKSAYPFAMLEKYPCSVFEKISAPPVWNDGNHHICLVEFKNIRARYDITPLSSSKRVCMQGAVLATDSPAENRKAGISRNNGKVIKAKMFVCYITEIDKRLIDMYYSYSDIIVHSHYIALSDYMPRHVIMYMLERYAQKTLLTGVDDEMRLLEKQKLNSIYGCCGTALVHDSITELDDYTFEKTRLDDMQIMAELAKLKQHKFKNTLPYSYGIYITSYQRFFLMEMCQRFKIKRGRKWVLDKITYMDTDSLKGFFTDADIKMIAAENERIKQWTKDRLALQDIPYEMSCPENTKGQREYLGIWEHDAHYYEAKFIRAKCYAYKETENDKTHITIAGVPKAAAHVLKSPDDLREGLEFDLFNSHKNMLTYRDGDNPLVTMPDGYKVKNRCACNIRPTSYKLTLEKEYRDLIKKYLTEKYH